MTIENLIKKYENELDKQDPFWSGNTTYIQLLKDFIKDLYSLDFVQNKILLVEDGSIDIDKEEEILNKMGYHIVIYRQGANKPKILGE